MRRLALFGEKKNESEIDPKISSLIGPSTDTRTVVVVGGGGVPE